MRNDGCHRLTTKRLIQIHNRLLSILEWTRTSGKCNGPTKLGHLGQEMLTEQVEPARRAALALRARLLLEMAGQRRCKIQPAMTNPLEMPLHTIEIPMERITGNETPKRMTKTLKD